MSWRRPPHVGVVLHGGSLGMAYLAVLPDGPIVCLEGVATALIHALEGGDGSSDSVVRHLADSLDLPTEKIDARAVQEFLDELVGRGLLWRQ